MFQNSSLQSASIYRCNELCVGAVIAHHQTVFVTAAVNGGLQLPPIFKHRHQLQSSNNRCQQQQQQQLHQQPRRIVVVEGHVPELMRLNPVLGCLSSSGNNNKMTINMICAMALTPFS